MGGGGPLTSLLIGVNSLLIGVPLFKVFLFKRRPRSFKVFLSDGY